MNAELEVATGKHVSRETYGKIERFADMLRSEARLQNLVSASTLDHLWSRHIIDSAQLVQFSPAPDAKWVDIGSGAGLPGIVLAVLLESPIALIEPRRLRAAFLEEVADRLDIGATVSCGKVENFVGRFDVITARAVAPLGRLLGMANHLAHADTLWVLPKGRNAKSELAEAEGSWHYDVRSEPSCTDPESEILLLRNVKAKSK